CAGRSRRRASSRAIRARSSARSTAVTRPASGRSTRSADVPRASASDGARRWSTGARRRSVAGMAAAASRGRVPVAVLGATGSTGVERLRCLARHPAGGLEYRTSEQYRDRRAADVYPFLAGVVDAPLQAPDPAAVAAAVRIVFTALPHGAAASLVEDLLRRG